MNKIQYFIEHIGLYWKSKYYDLKKEYDKYREEHETHENDIRIMYSQQKHMKNEISQLKKKKKKKRGRKKKWEQLN